MSTFTATAVPDRGAVLLQLNWSDQPAATTAVIYRVVDGVYTAVRMPAPTDADGASMLSGGTLVVWDTEMPLDVPVRYEARSPQLTGTLTAITVAQRITNGDFETGIAPWTVTGGAIAQSATHAHSGTYALRVTPTGGMQTITHAEDIPMAPQQTYTVDVWVWSTAGWHAVQLVQIFFDATGAFISSTYSGWTAVPVAGWFRLTQTVTAPACAASGRFEILFDDNPPATNIFYVDDVEYTGPDASVGRIADEYNRVVVDDWGNATTGEVWTVKALTAPEWDVAAGQGTIAMTGSLGTPRIAVIETMTDVDETVIVRVPAVATGAPLGFALLARYRDGLNYYQVEAQFTVGGTITLRLIQRIVGISTTLVSVATGIAYAATNLIGIRVQQVDSTLRAKVWNATAGGPPSAWTAQAAAPAITHAGQLGVRAVAEAGNTNAAPVTFAVQCFGALDLSLGAGVADVIVDSAEGGWLRNPLRPCDDLRIDLCGDPECEDHDDVHAWLINLDSPETYAADQGVFDIEGAALPDAVTNVRKGPAGSLALGTWTDADRDHLLALFAPGNVLLLQLPAAYGWPDRYLAVGELAVYRYPGDQRRTWRRFAVPWVQTSAPVGPAQGECGTRWMDLCARFDVWGDLDASGLTWNDILAGGAA